MNPNSASLESVTLFGHQTGDRSGSSGAKSGSPPLALATAQNQIPQVPAGFRVPFQAMDTGLEGGETSKLLTGNLMTLCLVFQTYRR